MVLFHPVEDRGHAWVWEGQTYLRKKSCLDQPRLVAGHSSSPLDHTILICEVLLKRVGQHRSRHLLEETKNKEPISVTMTKESHRANV